MRVSLFVYHLMFYGALVVAAIALLWYRVRPRPAKGGVPGARVVNPGAGASAKRLVLTWLPIVAIVGGPIAAYALHREAIDLVVVTDGPTGPTATRYVHLGSRPAFVLAPSVKDPDEDELSFSSDYTWIVNDSHRAVRVETVEYGRGFGFGFGPTVIPPGTASHELEVDHIGPGDHPPASVVDDVNLGFDSRTWLTWD